MELHDLERVLVEHPFTRGLAPEHITFLVGCAKNVRVRAGDFLMREGDQEDTLLLIRQGTVAIEAAQPGDEPVCIETLGPGDVLGVSGLTPRRANLDCRARENVLAITLDNRCLVRKMEADPRFGYAILSRLLERTYERLSRHRLQHLDVYR